jgi:hypothetical protein
MGNPYGMLRTDSLAGPMLNYLKKVRKKQQKLANN